MSASGPDENGQPVLRLHTVSKKYCRTLRRSYWYGILDSVRAVAGGACNRERLRPEEFWAVRSFTLTLQRGEIVGLTGPNGCGKTTVLRMIAGIIPPDGGEIHVRGTVCSLLALGAGFHPHMSVEENVVINGVLLGYTRNEVRERLGSILEYAGVVPFARSPAGALSPGLRVRLGFAIAVGLRPDVLLVDEILSVGDSAFRSMCLETIRTMSSRAGVVLVSHNPQTIARVCTRVVSLPRLLEGAQK